MVLLWTSRLNTVTLATTLVGSIFAQPMELERTLAAVGMLDTQVIPTVASHHKIQKYAKTKFKGTHFYGVTFNWSMNVITILKLGLVLIALSDRA